MAAAKSKKSTSLAKIAPADAVFIEPAPAFDQALTMIATTLSDRALAPAALTSTYDTIRKYQKLLAKMEELAKKHLKDLVVKTGTKKEDSKQIFLTVGDTIIEARPVNTKLDVKKVQALLIAKNLSPETWMDKEITYILNESKIQELVIKKKLTPDEVEACRHELKYSLQPPKKVNEATNDESEDRAE